MKIISLKFLIFTFIFSTISCENINSDIDIYNEKADELISQFINSEGDCDCIFSDIFLLTELYKNEQPKYDIKSRLIKKLDFEDESTLEYMESLSEGYKLNFSAINREVKIIKQSEVPGQFESIETDKSKDYIKKCPNFHYIISKPLFGKDFKIAIMHSGNAFSCFGTPPLVFKYEKGNWVNEGFL